MQNRKKSYRIKSKFRFTTSISITIILFFVMVNTVFGINDASSLTKEQPMLQVQIETGDKLWDIASEYGPDHTDPRKTVYDICSLNDISADSIYPGQTIMVPNYNN